MVVVLLLLSTLTPNATALMLCQDKLLGEGPYQAAVCLVRTVAINGYNPPNPPAPGAPPQSYHTFGQEFIQYHLYYLLCVTLNPPQADVGPECGPAYVVQRTVLP